MKKITLVLAMIFIAGIVFSVSSIQSIKKDWIPIPLEKVLDTNNCSNCYTEADSVGFYDGVNHNNYEVKNKQYENIHASNYWASGEYDLNHWVSVKWGALHAKYVTTLTFPINYNFNWFTDVKVEYSPYVLPDGSSLWVELWHDTNFNVSECDTNLLYNGTYYCDLEIPVYQEIYYLKITAKKGSEIAGAKENLNGVFAVNNIKIKYREDLTKAN